MDAYKPDDELLREKLLLNGFKITAVQEFNKLPSDKKAFLLQTNQKHLRKKLQQWAYENDVVMLINPQKITYNQCKRLFAFVVDDTFRDQFEYKHKLKDKFIIDDTDLESIKDFLEIQK